MTVIIICKQIMNVLDQYQNVTLRSVLLFFDSSWTLSCLFLFHSTLHLIGQRTATVKTASIKKYGYYNLLTPLCNRLRHNSLFDLRSIADVFVFSLFLYLHNCVALFLSVVASFNHRLFPVFLNVPF